MLKLKYVKSNLKIHTLSIDNLVYSSNMNIIDCVSSIQVNPLNLFFINKSLNVLYSNKYQYYKLFLYFNEMLVLLI